MGTGKAEVRSRSRPEAEDRRGEGAAGPRAARAPPAAAGAEADRCRGGGGTTPVVGVMDG